MPTREKKRERERGEKSEWKVRVQGRKRIEKREERIQSEGY